MFSRYHDPELLEMEKTVPHTPVLLDDVIKYLDPKDGEVIVDCTFGAGGYSKAILNQADCKLIAIDQDPEVDKFASEMARKYGDRFAFCKDNFANIASALAKVGHQKVDGIVADLGVSSMQLDQGHRGFSFLYDGPLDMRMSQKGRSAEELVNEASEDELADIIYKYGEERDARKIARRIVNERQNSRIDSTGKLAQIVRSAIGFRKSKIDLATKTFQALRIWVNDELGALETLLSEVDNLLKPGGRLVIVSFHSLEDSIVKHTLREKAAKKIARSKYATTQVENPDGIYDLIVRKSVKPSVEETINNPRARSAKLRAARRI